MPSLRREAVLTTYSPEEVFTAIYDALERLDGEPPSLAYMLVLAAQSAQETSRWREMYNNNIGNVKASVTKQPHYMISTTELMSRGMAEKYLAAAAAGPNEGDASLKNVVLSRVLPPNAEHPNERWVLRFYPEHPACAFRSFDTLEEGVDDHFNFLRLPRFARALKAARAGDPSAYSHALADQIYYTQDRDIYTSGEVSIFKEYSKRYSKWVRSFEETAYPRKDDVTSFDLRQVSQDEINESFRGERENS